MYAICTCRPLDAERQSSYTLTVSAVDAANVGMRKQSSAKVHVTVDDVNDNSPLFKEGQKQTVYFNENEPAGARYSTVIHSCTVLPDGKV